MATPKGAFADTWGRDMFTFGGVLTLPAGRLPFQWGFDFGYGIMGRKARSITVAEPDLGATEGRLAVNAKVLGYHPLLRFSPLTGKVRPYVDGLVGLRHFTTQSTITVDGLHEPLSQERLANDLALSAGWAAGLMVGLGQVGYIEARIESINGGKATYVDPATVAMDGQGHVSFNTLKSTTGNVNLLVGIGLRF